MRTTSVEPKKDEFLAVSDEHFEKFKKNLAKKLQMSFQNSSEAIGFFDLTGTETLRIDEFLFGVQFFISGSRLKECLMLFNLLDKNKDGQLEEFELDALFLNNEIKDNQESIGQLEMNNYL